MSKTIINIEKISKMYRVFHSQKYRILDALGFPIPRNAYEEAWAIRDISLEIKAGERVGLIGRNGAGKSTILKIIAELLKPTSGKVNVQGKVKTLLELGTGFHPEFSGRENVLSSLAYQGVTGKAALKLLDEIIDFSELDEHIDKPLKTYSSGMSARLAFASATVIRPEILIIDEILGAGDAYFASKSTKRMRALTNEGTTVLFVSHDLSAVQMLCDRAVWIERGALIADGHPIEIGKAYVASIKKQEELRLRAINLKLSRGDISELLTDNDTDKVFILRFISAEEGPPNKPLRFYQIRLKYKEELIDKVDIGLALDDDRSQRLHVLSTRGYMNWSKPKQDKQGHYFREFGDFKGQYKHAPISIRIPMGLGELDAFSVEITHSGTVPEDTVLCQIFDGFEYVTLGTLQKSQGSPLEQGFSLSSKPKEQVQTLEEPSPVFSYEEGSAWVEDVDFCNAENLSQRVFVFGEKMHILIHWRAKYPINNMAFVVCIYGMDGRCVTQVLSPKVSATETAKSGQIQAAFDPLRIGVGDYVVSIGIFHGMTEDKCVGEYPLDIQDRQYRIKIMAPTHIKMERGVVIHEANWLELV